MTAPPHAAMALTSALDRFGLANTRLLEAVTGRGEEAPEAALVDMTMAKTQVKASVAVVRFADEMWAALLEIGEDENER